MPNINDLFPTKFLKAHDLQGKEPVVTIARVELEPMGRTREMKAVLYFRGKAKGLKLNKTMASALSEMAGSPQTEAWVGLAIQLFSTVADFGGQTFPVVRLRAPIRTELRNELPPARPRPVPAPVRAATGTDGPRRDDDLPF